MRKLSMKGKRKNSPESDGEPSDENGVASIARASSDDNAGSDESASEKSDKNTKSRRSNKKKRSSRSRGKQEDQVDESHEGEGEEKPAGNEQENGQKSGSKRRRKEEKPAAPAQNEEDQEDVEYEVEKVVAQRTIKGRRQFLVRWKGYEEDADTWEQEKDLNCAQLIEEFLAEQADEESNEKTPKASKSKGAKKSSKKGKKDEGDKDAEANEEDQEKEFEVERIIEVHFKKDKTREFLIRWKGFSQSDDTWEPEKNLNCPHLIAKFMEKVDNAKKSDRRELRANPSLTKHYTLSAHGRRHSRRNVDKQRVTYQGCDE